MRRPRCPPTPKPTACQPRRHCRCPWRRCRAATPCRPPAGGMAPRRVSGGGISRGAAEVVRGAGRARAWRLRRSEAAPASLRFCRCAAVWHSTCGRRAGVGLRCATGARAAGWGKRRRARRKRRDARSHVARPCAAAARGVAAAHEAWRTLPPPQAHRPVHCVGGAPVRHDASSPGLRRSAAAPARGLRPYAAVVLRGAAHHGARSAARRRKRAQARRDACRGRGAPEDTPPPAPPSRRRSRYASRSRRCGTCQAVGRAQPGVRCRAAPQRATARGA